MFSKAQFVTVFVSAILCLAAIGSAENLVTNPGFETAESTSGSWPSTCGDWNGDYSSIANATAGIAPVESSKMLQFLGSGLNGCGSADTCQVFQLIDVSSYQILIASGNAKATASASFNRVAGDAQTDTKYDVGILALNGLPGTFPSRWNTYGYDATLGYQYAGAFYMDALPLTWESISVTLNIPVGTTFLAVNLNMNENIYNDYSSPEFDGHFVDNVSLQIIPEPATLFFFAAGVLGLFRRK